MNNRNNKAIVHISEINGKSVSFSKEAAARIYNELKPIVDPQDNSQRTGSVEEIAKIFLTSIRQFEPEQQNVIISEVLEDLAVDFNRRWAVARDERDRHEKAAVVFTDTLKNAVK